ncbi:hypothetical protein L484_013458 [Morus notabilis]|uniref:VWFA domain-containing protein n=1 Tax=Morus notabilis TaxID=981085 RepID=W9QNN7_9ROSA|nr:hypothetical protein L484_013458 [Morus notabilis]
MERDDRALTLKFKYLGLPLGGNPLQAAFWDLGITRVSRRLDGWKKAFLSKGGRLTLIQSVLASLPIYFLSVFKIPVGVADAIEKLMRDFLWEGFSDDNLSHLVAWEQVHKPKDLGGLRIGNIRKKNEALLAKWLWRFSLEPEALCCGIRNDGETTDHLFLQCTYSRKIWSLLLREFGFPWATPERCSEVIIVSPPSGYSQRGLIMWRAAVLAIFWGLWLERNNRIFENQKEDKEELTRISKHLEAALRFSLVCSSRPPQMFSPHKKLLWILGAWTSVDSVNAKVANFVLEMWFTWHQSLWIYHPVSVQDSSEISQQDSVTKSGADSYDIPVPDMLLHPVMMNTVYQILQSPTPVKEYLEGSLKLKVASCNLWRSLSPGSKLPGFLSSAAWCLFGQIINAHQKAFEADKFEDIKSIVHKLSTNMIEKESFNRKFEEIRSGILSSSHQGLKTSMDMHITPLLRELCHDCASTDCIPNIGRAWLHLGALRLNLLLSCDDLDPAMKYHYKNSQLADKISSLKLEIQVRQECNYLAGQLSTREDDKKEALEKLEAKRRRLQRKIVFRSDYGKFKNLKHECEEFLERVTQLKFLWTEIEAMDLKKICDDWQKTATRFIEQLSINYLEYIDFVQPVQVAVYELKLGFSLLSRVEKNKMDVEPLYTFMRFPSTSPLKTKSIKLKSEQPGFPPYELEIYADFCVEDVDVPHKLDMLYSKQPEVSRSQLKAYLHQSKLFRTAHSVSNVHIMDSVSFLISHKSFMIFSDFWKNMKENQVKMREDDSQQYKFRSREFKIENVIELDISTLGKSLANESFLEWKELVLEDEQREDACKEQDHSEEDWNLIDDSVLNSVVHIHDHLFGLNSSIITGAFQISDEDRFFSFIGSYTFGTMIIRGLAGSFLSNLDARLAPEHLFRLCLEHDKKFVSSHKSARRYNFYKDSNALEISKMAKLLNPLEQRVRSLLDEWENDHALQKLLNVIEMLLNIPLSTPLAKVLSGLQFLVNNIRILQENGSKIPISDQLDDILVLVVSWQKLEFESWPVLLDEVQQQYDINAGKLWFPLYPILLGKSWSGTSNSIQSWCEKENMDLSCYEEEKMKILFNVIGFYVQFLPRILEHIEDSRKKIEQELKELLKLCSWERLESFLSIENSKRTRQKFKKLIQKYNDLLQQPAMLFLNQDAELKKTIQSKDGQKFLGDCTERNSRMVDASSDLTLRDYKDRFEWYAEWRKNVEGAIRSLKLNKNPNFSALHSLSKGMIRQCLYKDEWNAVWFRLERIFRTVVDCGDLWKEENKSQQKRRALSELLKLLESSGLSRHKAVYIEDQVKSWWFLEPSHELQHLLPAQNRLTYGASNAAVALSKPESSPLNYLSSEWKTATEYYFRTIASVLLLRQICLNSHKDITLEQVERSCSFIYQLIEIQQKQHAASVVFAEHLKCFKEHISILKNLHSNCTSSDDGSHSMFDIVRNEDAIFKCMWQQKLLFDSLCSISHDELLLLRTFERNHSETCENVKASSHEILEFVEKFFPIFQNSKELLDNNLLGGDRDITIVPASPYLFVVSRQMEALVSQNFQIIEDFKKHLDGLIVSNGVRSSVKETLLGHFKAVFDKKKLVEDEFISETLVKNVSLRTLNKGFSELDDKFLPALKRTIERIKQAMQILCSPPNGQSVPDESGGSITSWSVIFDSLVKNLCLEHLCIELLEVIFCAKELLKDSADKFQSLAVQIGSHLKNLLVFLDMLSNFGDALLQEHLDMHKTVSMMTRVLADVLASLYSRGFGISSEDQVSNGTQDAPQDASGTGMGEGVGLKDVSDQITDEDQLLGASDKLEEEQGASGEAPNKHDKGIEMDQDFDADTFDVSEDSEEDMDEDGEDEHLDSAMGETGADGEVVNEKLWNKDEDESPNDAPEKYESGPSVKDTEASSRELRAKDDSAFTADEPGEFNSQEVDKSDGETGEQDDVCDDGENIEDVNLDKEEAFADSTDMKPDDVERSFEEDMDLDKEEGIDSVEEAEGELQDEAADYRNSDEENPHPTDETMEEVETGQLDPTSERDELGGDQEQNAETNLMGSRREMLGLGTSDSFGGDSVPNSESSTQPKSDLQASDLSNIAPEMNWSNNDDTHSGLAPLRGLPSGNTSELDRMVSESMNSGRNSSDQPQSQLPGHESVQKNEPNPHRSRGDPLKEWRGVKVGVDLKADDTDAQGDIQDENADEFGYVSEFEKGTSQALGPATSEQVDSNVNGNKANGTEPTTDRDDVTEMEIEKETSERHPLKNGASFLKSKFKDKMPVPDLENNPREESKEIQGHGDFKGLSDGIVSIRKSYFSEGVNQLGKLSINDSELGKPQDNWDISTEALNDSTALWRRCELSTTRLSQELAEQLRLVMEPTVASKLQGDYKTGKRINMKKVIPYIASHFRRDKIWLRRTRLNKRDYQVVIAVDDSRSMSESCCGNVAIEALVAVCRAMSQLEMGNLAVTSFGKKGNIRLLHDFDQPFTAETGVKMVSSFTFEQENTIADEPVVDLLKYLNNKLDAAVAKARLPSGQNPLEQLVLIIADGRFHEKENLKRCVRDFLSRKRMVAFLLLDSPQESIVDLMEASFEGGSIKFSMYLDSFPFPFYIVLRNIEALPKTLADLLRQWFELMQYSRE